MNTEKRAGDKGMTTLSGSGMVAKSDERIALIGAIEELSCYIGYIKAGTSCPHLTAVLERIQRALASTADGVRDRFGKTPSPASEEISFLEHEIAYLDTQTAGENDADTAEEDRDAKLPGKNRGAALFQMAASIARRAERELIAVDRRYGVRPESRQYLNRLSDYFESAAEYRIRFPEEEDVRVKKAEPPMEQVVRQVMNQMGVSHEVTLQEAKQIIEEVEKEADRRGTKAVICVCDGHGHPVAVHVMDGAFLVSFDVAIKKAYTSVAVKMPTIELGPLAAPGQTFYGVDKMDGGKITVIGGGIPLKKGGIICGAVGVSGGTGEEDDSLARYAADIYSRI
ncbi:MAG: ATP:cob(I)alamin adenosyltransferase [Candidatus Choladocola sp.]|nr:ATP:cob(I)alamin adenosyltransferase [Candidatus Choladocola sp.]